MNRSLLIYALVLVGSLGWAYQTWTHEDELTLAEKVVLLPGSPEELVSVVYRGPELELTLDFREDEQGRYAWGRAEPKGAALEPPEPAPVEDGAEDGTEDGAEPPPAPPVPQPEEFKVGKAGDPVIEAMAPFVAKRRLEGVGDDLSELGLEQSEATLEITREGKEPKVYELGSNVFGGTGVYLRDPADGAIYLVEARLIRPLLDGARTLPDRELTGVDERKVERLTLRVGERQASFTQHNPDDRDARYWSVTGEDDKSAEATAWADKLLRLRSSRYVQQDEAVVDLASAFDFVVEAGDGPVLVEVLRSFDDDGQEQFFARSPHTRGLVKLPRVVVAEVSADLESVLQAGGA